MSGNKVVEHFTIYIYTAGSASCGFVRMGFGWSSCNSVLVLSDGRRFFGRSIGKRGKTIGEVCFTTGCVGYQCTVTDPSFSRQIITFTSPHIGNVGINSFDSERNHPLASGIVVRELSRASHVDSCMNLHSWLTDNSIVGISGVDTRALTHHLRNFGSQIGIIMSYSEVSELDFAAIATQLQNARSMMDIAAVAVQDCAVPTVEAINPKYKVVAVDFGIKVGAVSCLARLGCEVTVISATKNFAKEVLALNPDGVMLSNGPGDPEFFACYALSEIQEIIESGIPVFGICMGHQLLAQALGAKIVKMTNGHRGCNHPVYNVESGAVEITSQNHGFAVDESSLPERVVVTHRSLFDRSIEGIRLQDMPVFSVQYHPEGRPGPRDSYYLFDQFIGNMSRFKSGAF